MLARAVSPAVLVAGVLAPVALIGGWTWAAAARSDGFDAVERTISALAAQHAPHRWIMTSMLALYGACLLVIAAGWIAAGPPARLLIGLGGLGTLAVAVFAQPSSLHGPAAGLAFVAMAIWPAFLRGVPRTLRLAATGVLVALLVWFAVTQRSGTAVGLVERLLAGAEALCPVGLLFARRMRTS